MSDEAVREFWYKALTEGENRNHRLFHLLGLIPANPRCKMCNAPFKGIGRIVSRLFGKKQSKQNPYFCNYCLLTPAGGAEVELTMLFADVRGSTALAEKISPSEFSRLMERFFKVATDILVRTDALIDKLVGDQVIGLYVPGWAGKQHAHQAFMAAKELLKATGHGKEKKPWLPIGIGVHTGIAYVGAVAGAEGIITDITALGDNVNTTARLASTASAGEILITEAACNSSGIRLNDHELRLLDLKGKSSQVGVRVVRV
ncbi:MAG: adenylate/guanylate cyclase domain-containing protein [Ignavibacteriae bacterium]|nr:adenylate/guanylate cyclase domain-containing protein [Ignavibacteriota bacterium]